MHGLKANLASVYANVEADVLARKPTAIYLMKSGHLLVPLAFSEDQYVFGPLVKLTEVAAYYCILESGVERTLAIPRNDDLSDIAFKLYDALQCLFDALTSDLLPETRITEISGVHCRVFPYFDLSLRRAVRMRSLSALHINMYLHQLARYLQIGEYMHYNLGIYSSSTIFVNSKAPLLLIVPEFPKCHKITYNAQTSFYQRDPFYLGALLYELATGEELLASGTRFQTVKQIIQLFGPHQITRDLHSDLFADYAPALSDELRRLGFKDSEPYYPIAEVLSARSKYDFDYFSGESIAFRMLAKIRKLGGATEPEMQKLAALVEALTGVDATKVFPLVKKYFGW